LKKHLIVLALVFYVLIGSFLVNSLEKTYNNTINTNASSVTVFAKINNNCNFLKTPTQIFDYSNVYFILEESYFVKVLNVYSNHYYCEYLNIKGYVEKQNLTLVNENISHPYLLNITFNTTKTACLYNEPSTKSNVSFQIEKGEQLMYIGKILGSEIDNINGNIWYYCTLVKENTNIFGYIHSSFTNNLTPINVNESEFSAINTTTSSLLNLNLTTQVVIIICISIPLFFILYLLLKGFKKV